MSTHYSVLARSPQITLFSYLILSLVSKKVMLPVNRVFTWQVPPYKLGTKQEKWVQCIWKTLSKIILLITSKSIITIPFQLRKFKKKACSIIVIYL